MRHFIPHIIAFVIGIFVLWIACQPIQSFFQKKHPFSFVVNQSSYIDHFSETQPDANFKISQCLQQGIPLIMGSSELTAGHLKAISYHFFKEKNRLIQALGHAGFQSFAISSVLAANAEYLKNAKLLIILSPGWFEGNYAKGTELTCFFEYNNSYALQQQLENKYIPEDYKHYYSNYLSKKYGQINAPNVFINLLAHRNNALYSPINKANRWLYEQTISNSYHYNIAKEFNNALVKNTTTYQFKKVNANWDSLYQIAISAFEKTSTNNTLAIENDYYNDWVKGKPLKKVVLPAHNQELQDLKMLLKLCKQLNAQPRFVIMPLNPNVYSNLSELSPVINEIKSNLETSNFYYLDMFTPNVANYQKGVLNDIMHPADYGWYQIDKFIAKEFGK